MAKKTNSAALICILLFTFSTGYSQNWPCFHGADRTNKSSGTGLLKEWPAAGPALSLTITGLGDGYSSVAVNDGLIYTLGQSDNQSYVYCY
jgi:hypothetical protein